MYDGGHCSLRAPAKVANSPRDRSFTGVPENIIVRQPLQQGSPKLPVVGTKMNCTPGDQSAVIPPMKRRLITLSTAGNLKISPLAPQQLQQRRPTAALRATGDSAAIETAIGAVPSFGPAFLTRQLFFQSVQDQAEGGSSHCPAEATGCYGESRQYDVLMTQNRPTSPGRDAGEAIGMIPAGEIRTPSRLVLRPMRLLQSAGDAPCHVSPSLAAQAGSPLTTVGLGLFSPSRKRLPEHTPMIQRMSAAARQPTSNAIATANGEVDGPEYSLRPPDAVLQNGADMDCSSPPCQGFVARAGEVQSEIELYSPLQLPPQPLPHLRQQQHRALPLDVERSEAGSPVGGGSHAARCSSSNPVDDANLVVGCAHQGAQHAPEASQQASACVGTSDPPPAGAPVLSQLTVPVTVAVRAKKGRGQRLREDSNGGYVRGSMCGVVDLVRYMEGRDCVLCSGRWVSRSQFEKLGGSAMAKWYRSIRVLPDLEPLGEWLERHGLPVLKGPGRRSRRRHTVADSGDDNEEPEQQPIPRLQSWHLWQNVHAGDSGTLPAGTGRQADGAMMAALLATAAAAAGESRGAALASPVEDSLAGKRSGKRTILHREDSGRGGDEGLVQRLLDSWPLSQPFLLAPAEPLGVAAACGAPVQPLNLPGGGSGNPRPLFRNGGECGKAVDPGVDASAMQAEDTPGGRGAAAAALAPTGCDAPGTFQQWLPSQLAMRQLQPQAGGDCVDAAFSYSRRTPGTTTATAAALQGLVGTAEHRQEGTHADTGCDDLARSPQHIADSSALRPQRSLHAPPPEAMPQPGPAPGLSPPAARLTILPRSQQLQYGGDSEDAGVPRPRLLLRASLPAGGGSIRDGTTGLTQPYVLSIQAPAGLLYSPPPGSAANTGSADSPELPARGGSAGADSGILDGAWARRC